jgi:N-methylhydantoinase A
VPTTASVLSAWGMLTSDLRYEVSRTHFESGAHSSADEVREIFADLEGRATQRLQGWFNGPIEIERAAEMRYGEQIFEIDVALDGIDLNSPSLIAEIEERFHRRHEELYTYASRDQEVVFVNARVAAVGRLATHDASEPAVATTEAATPRGTRRAFFGGWRDVPVFALDALVPGHTLQGPAIIEAETTTVVISAGDALTVNGLGWLDIRVCKAPGT